MRNVLAWSLLTNLGKRYKMGFKIGDKVIHWTYGLGEIVQIEEKPVHDKITNCYVFKTSEITIWIPIDALEQQSLRQPTEPGEFPGLYDILASPGEALHEDRVQRKYDMMNRLKDGHLSSICRLVRDLTLAKRNGKLNYQEKYILERAEQSLLMEWTYALGTPMLQAHQAMTSMLGG
jgi:RNA polymerase-interacting CarD/CdnL/TRCF family regulator